MPIISGRLVFDINRSGSIDITDTGIANVPIVLHRIVESYGYPGGLPTPVNFTSATIGLVPVGNDTPITFTTAPPASATDLDSITPNTFSPITIFATDLSNLNFLDGPVIYTPITEILDACATIDSNNLITTTDFGTFGSFLAGTSANTGATLVHPIQMLVQALSM